MSRLTDLIRQARAKDSQLGTDLEAEVRELTRRRAFGLVFERHQPEAVELPGVTASVGSKVRLLRPRGEVGKGDQRLWRVVDRDKALGVVSIVELNPPTDADAESAVASADDLVVVMEFDDRMFPGLAETGRVERGGEAPFHTVINGENFHALQMLAYTHRGKVDAIYIDPPYNSGAKDWKYNNDYVEGDDAYRHSKWLAMMERRLLLARELLSAHDSVLIVTIDEKEYLRLGLLLEQVFADARIQMVSSVINPKGTSRPTEFSRTDEYIYFVMIGNARPQPEPVESATDSHPVEWGTLRRRDLGSVRATRPGQFYPIFVETSSGKIQSIGEAIAHTEPRESVVPPEGCIAVFPVRPDGTEMNWGVTAPSLRTRLENGYVKTGKYEPNAPQKYVVTYLKSGPIADIEAGRARILRREPPNNSVVAEYVGNPTRVPTTNWQRRAHNADNYGSVLLREVLGGRKFPFPKSLYAVEDCLRFFLKDKPKAVILDFFAGSGTTAHAVMRLNKEDGGSRQAILISNNEVGAEEQRELRAGGLRPGDLDWEKFGICDYITKPRVEAAITGKTPDGAPIEADYKFTDEFPMADGFEQNAAFFTLTYEQPLTVARDRAFARIAPLLWMRSGSTGRVLDDVGEDGWDISDFYGVLADPDSSAGFVAAVAERPKLRTAFIITDEDAVFRSVAHSLPEHVEPVRLYESYLHTFEVGGGVA